jgi:hypothetical protein
MCRAIISGYLDDETYMDKRFSSFASDSVEIVLDQHHSRQFARYDRVGRVRRQALYRLLSSVMIPQL